MITNLTELYKIREALGFNQYYGVSNLADDASALRKQRDELLAAVLASEREYENLEADAPVDAGCIQCMHLAPFPTGLNTGLCAHHLRRAVLAKAGVRL